jgi:hypothetical protein
MIGRHATFAASLIACCWYGYAHAQSVLPDNPESTRLDLPNVTMLTARHAFNLTDTGTEPRSLAHLSSPPQSSVPSYNTRDDPQYTRDQASSYIAIDSWVYPALDRLIALGYIQTGSLAIRPFTRMECARLLAEAHILATDQTLVDDSDLASLLLSLDQEFAHESRVIDGDANTGGIVEQVYARYNGIAASPLRDSFHFGQTVYNDFGRPYGQGSNAVAGLSGHAEHGPFSIYLRGEYQHAASSPAYSASAQQTIEAFDSTTEGWQLSPGAAAPLPFNFNPASASRFRLIEGYAAVNLANWQISAGQQSLWWGPDRTTSLILSNNAAAMPMIRIGRATPAKLPGFLGYLGPLHFDAFFARQGGIHYVALGPKFVLDGNQSNALTPPPYLYGITFSVEPTKNLEVAFAHTVVFAGYGRPLTFGTFFHTFDVTGNGQAVDPGKRVTEFNFSYHVPGFRHSLLVYTEAMAWDDPVQGHFTARYALDPGVYLPKIPYINKLDLRLEGVYTDLPGLPETGYYYANAHYPQGYTNYGQILGSWIGRQGRGGEATTTYWLSSRTKAAATYRRMVANPVLLQGGNLTDVSGSFTWLINPRLEVSTVQQYERWRFPVLNESPRSNFSTTFQIQFLNRPRL